MKTITYQSVDPKKVSDWQYACDENLFPEDGGLCVEVNGLQIAVFKFTRRNEWFATQNLCPHKQQMILSRGMIGSIDDEPKVACPYHKNTFSLKNGKHLSGTLCDLATYPVKVESGKVYVGVG